MRNEDVSSETGSLLVALGAVLALVWSGWLGWALGQSRDQIGRS